MSSKDSRIERPPEQTYLVMKMRAGCLAAFADVTYDLPSADSDPRVNAGTPTSQVGVSGFKAIPVREPDEAPITPRGPSEGHHAPARGQDRGSNGRRVIYPGMEAQGFRDWMYSEAKYIAGKAVNKGQGEFFTPVRRQVLADDCRLGKRRLGVASKAQRINRRLQVRHKKQRDAGGKEGFAFPH